MNTYDKCGCVQKAIYALKCAQIPTDIFSRITCLKCPAESSAEDCVTLYLCPDTAVTESADTTKWPVVYHGASVSAVKSILEHGTLLMKGDTLHDGTILGKWHTVEQQMPAIWTYPDAKGAKIAASDGTYDKGLVEIKVLLRLRQKPSSYKVHKGCGFGYDVWSTERRGTLVIEALDVYVNKSRDTGTMPWPQLMPCPNHEFLSTFKCPVQQQTFNVMQFLKIPQSVFDMRHNRCHCKQCYPNGWPDLMIVAGEKYAFPARMDTILDWR